MINKFLIRGVALLLVPCLVADPVAAAVYPHFNRPCVVVRPEFSVQALVPLSIGSRAARYAPGKLSHRIIALWRNQVAVWESRRAGVGNPDRHDFIQAFSRMFLGVPFTRVWNPVGVSDRPRARMIYRILVPVYAVASYKLFYMFSGPGFGYGIVPSLLFTVLSLNVAQAYAEQILSKETNGAYVNDSARKVFTRLIYHPIFRPMIFLAYLILFAGDPDRFAHMRQAVSLMWSWGMLPLLSVLYLLGFLSLWLSRKNPEKPETFHSHAFLFETSVIGPPIEEVLLRWGALQLQIVLFVQVLGLPPLFAISLNALFFHQLHDRNHRNNLAVLPISLVLPMGYAKTGSVVVAATMHQIWNSLQSLYNAFEQALWHRSARTPSEGLLMAGNPSDGPTAPSAGGRDLGFNPLTRPGGENDSRNGRLNRERWSGDPVLDLSHGRPRRNTHEKGGAPDSTVTVRISKRLDSRIEAIARIEGKRKKQIVKEALSQHLPQIKSEDLPFHPRGEETILVTYLIPKWMAEMIQRIKSREGWTKARILADAFTSYVRLKSDVLNRTPNPTPNAVPSSAAAPTQANPESHPWTWNPHARRGSRPPTHPAEVIPWSFGESFWLFVQMDKVSANFFPSAADYATARSQRGYPPSLAFTHLAALAHLGLLVREAPVPRRTVAYYRLNPLVRSTLEKDRELMRRLLASAAMRGHFGQVSYRMEADPEVDRKELEGILGFDLSGHASPVKNFSPHALIRLGPHARMMIDGITPDSRIREVLAQYRIGDVSREKALHMLMTRFALDIGLADAYLTQASAPTLMVEEPTPPASAKATADKPAAPSSDYETRMREAHVPEVLIPAVLRVLKDPLFEGLPMDVLIRDGGLTVLLVGTRVPGGPWNRKGVVLSKFGENKYSFGYVQYYAPSTGRYQVGLGRNYFSPKEFTRGIGEFLKSLHEGPHAEYRIKWFQALRDEQTSNSPAAASPSAPGRAAPVLEKQDPGAAPALAGFSKLASQIPYRPDTLDATLINLLEAHWQELIYATESVFLQARSGAFTVVHGIFSEDPKDKEAVIENGFDLALSKDHPPLGRGIWTQIGASYYGRYPEVVLAYEGKSLEADQYHEIVDLIWQQLLSYPLLITKKNELARYIFDVLARHFGVSGVHMTWHHNNVTDDWLVIKNPNAIKSIRDAAAPNDSAFRRAA